ncbi:metal-dependent hydrolase [Natrarchaeobius chitinivorans]|uniref:Metal-dependent hydrolase n=1 Tax=Natrarchaeobius chitinivorans TaxID=1679083 RepID=A0A3N6LRG2_NATCH|nr:metal-dependent hydrolase [Natrarchaeobius chitinivorans]RQG90977.1 metal-dependent hydrolase [Natrarchaeobius chitinivorans]
MADVLTHVLAGYVIGSLVALRYDWARTPHVTMVMIGALSPDFKKIDHVITDGMVTSALGIPWGWTALHTTGGTIVVALLGSLLVAPGHRKRVIALIVIGAASHHVLDLLLVKGTGYTYPVLWPFVEYRPPAGGLYLSSDRWPALLTGTIAAVLWGVRRRYDRSPSSGYADPASRP